MKTIVSTKVMSNSIRKALADYLFNQVTFYSDRWVLHRTCVKDITLYCEISFKDSNIDQGKKYTLNRLTWHKLQFFLSEIPEQPILIDATEERETSLGFRLSQFVMEF